MERPKLRPRPASATVRGLLFATVPVTELLVVPGRHLAWTCMAAALCAFSGAFVIYDSSVKDADEWATAHSAGIVWGYRAYGVVIAGFNLFFVPGAPKYSMALLVGLVLGVLLVGRARGTDVDDQADVPIVDE